MGAAKALLPSALPIELPPRRNGFFLPISGASEVSDTPENMDLPSSEEPSEPASDALRASGLFIGEIELPPIVLEELAVSVGLPWRGCGATGAFTVE